MRAVAITTINTIITTCTSTCNCINTSNCINTITNASNCITVNTVRGSTLLDSVQ